MILLARVDNRLLHGQVLETWIPRLKIQRVVVADDEAARSPLARAAMTLCLPPGLSAEIRAVDAVDWDALARAPERVLVLFREVEGLVRAAAAGLTPEHAPEVNLGNVHFTAGRRPVTPSLFLSPEEGRALARLEAAGYRVSARAVPTEVARSAADVVKRSGAGDAA